MTDLERVIGFHRFLEECCCDRIFPAQIATALLNSSIPLVYDRNYVRVEYESANAGELASLTDRLLGAAGLSHRKIVCEQSETGERLAPQFERLGWTIQKLLVMVHTGTVEEEPIPLVAELEPVSMLPFWSEDNRNWHPDNEELARQLTQEHALAADCVDTRFFGRREDGRLVSACDLYLRGGAAQVEHVATLPDYRNRGLASSIVRRAIAEAKRSGHDLVWLLADESGWPKALYARLGFTPLARFYAFVKT
jgi:GNAT superfamily N-acetyltransferase